MERVKITAIIAAILYLCSVSAQDTLHVQQYLGIGASTQMVISGDTITAGMPVYINRTNKRAYRADKAGAKKQAQAIALTTCLPMDTTILCYSGRIIDYPGPLSKGDSYYLSGTKGGIVSDKTDASTGFQKLGVAIDSFVMEVDIDDVVTIPATPGLDAVTAVGATSYNDIVISDGSYDVIKIKGAGSEGIIEFFDVNEENTLKLRPPAAITSFRDVYLPNKTGTLAVTIPPIILPADITTSSNTLADVSGMSFSVATGGIYSVILKTRVQSNTLTNGAKFAITYTGTGTPIGEWKGHITASAAATALNAPVVFGTAFTTTAVNPINGDHFVGCEFFFSATIGGTVQLQFASEVNTNTSSLMAGSMFVIEQLN